MQLTINTKLKRFDGCWRQHRRKSLYCWIIYRFASGDGVVSSNQKFSKNEELLRKCTKHNANTEKGTKIIGEESEKKIEQPNKKALFKTLCLIAGWTLLQDHGITRVIKTCAAQLNIIVTMTSIKKQRKVISCFFVSNRKLYLKQNLF